MSVAFQTIRACAARDAALPHYRRALTRAIHTYASPEEATQVAQTVNSQVNTCQPPFLPPNFRHRVWHTLGTRSHCPHPTRLLTARFWPPQRDDGQPHNANTTTPPTLPPPHAGPTCISAPRHTRCALVSTLHQSLRIPRISACALSAAFKNQVENAEEAAAVAEKANRATHHARRQRVA